jgi:hypothetical protein
MSLIRIYTKDKHLVLAFSEELLKDLIVTPFSSYACVVRFKDSLLQVNIPISEFTAQIENHEFLYFS